MKQMLLFCVAALISASVCFGQETYSVWPSLAPGEKGDKSAPELKLYKPAEKKTDTCLIVFPGGGYYGLASDHEGTKIAQYFNEKGMTVAVLLYRVPRRDGVEKHVAAWQDAQRAIRFVRSHAVQWGINPEKIGAMGFSAGGHLTLMCATSSQTPAYEPVDELDKTPCHLNFAAPVYPAYVLEDGADGTNSNKGFDSPIVKEFAFDAKTPPMCLIHGDDDGYSSMGSVAVYTKLKKMSIPAELHIFAKVGHGFGARPTLDPQNKHVGDWLNRVYEWTKVVGF